jgi:hypothetical protein
MPNCNGIRFDGKVCPNEVEYGLYCRQHTWFCFPIIKRIETSAGFVCDLTRCKQRPAIIEIEQSDGTKEYRCHYHTPRGGGVKSTRMNTIWL